MVQSVVVHSIFVINWGQSSSWTISDINETATRCCHYLTQWCWHLIVIDDRPRDLTTRALPPCLQFPLESHHPIMLTFSSWPEITDWPEIMSECKFVCGGDASVMLQSCSITIFPILNSFYAFACGSTYLWFLWELVSLPLCLSTLVPTGFYSLFWFRFPALFSSLHYD